MTEQMLIDLDTGQMRSVDVDSDSDWPDGFVALDEIGRADLIKALRHKHAQLLAAHDCYLDAINATGWKTVDEARKMLGLQEEIQRPRTLADMTPEEIAAHQRGETKIRLNR